MYRVMQKGSSYWISMACENCRINTTGASVFDNLSELFRMLYKSLGGSNRTLSALKSRKRYMGRLAGRVLESA